MLLIQKINNILNSRQYYNSYFNRCINKYKKIENYISIYDSISKSHDKFIKTSKNISYNKYIFFGTSLYKAKRQIRLPYRLIKNTPLCDIIFFKKKIGSYKIIVELHFFKKKLVFFKYSFPKIENKKVIINTIISKYLKKENDYNFIRNLNIYNNNNYIKIENEVSLEVYYFSSGFGFYDFLLENKKEIKFRELTKKQFSFNKLLEQI